MKLFTERLKELRLEKKLSQQALADAIFVSQSAVTYWENGKREPTLSAIIALSKFFGVSSDYLLGIEND